MAQAMPAPRVQEPPFSEEEIWEFQRAHPGWRIQVIGGSFVLSPPNNPESGRQNANRTRILGNWTLKHGYQCFDSSSGFRMPDGDVLAPDTSLMRNERWQMLAREQRKRFTPPPDVAVELLSKTDSIREMRRKCDRMHRDGTTFVVMLDPENGIAECWGNAPEEFPDRRRLLRETVKED